MVLGDRPGKVPSDLIHEPPGPKRVTVVGSSVVAEKLRSAQVADDSRGGLRHRSRRLPAALHRPRLLRGPLRSASGVRQDSAREIQVRLEKSHVELESSCMRCPCHTPCPRDAEDRCISYAAGPSSAKGREQQQLRCHAYCRGVCHPEAGYFLFPNHDTFRIPRPNAHHRTSSNIRQTQRTPSPTLSGIASIARLRHRARDLPIARRSLSNACFFCR